MSPLAWLLHAQLLPGSLVIALGVKWWTIWFVLRRDFTHTTWLTLTAMAWTAAVSLALRFSGALGAAARAGEGGEPPLPLLAWVTAVLVVGAGGAALETAWLHASMRRLVRRDWNWRRYDRIGYWFAHGCVLALALANAHWLGW